MTKETDMINSQEWTKVLDLFECKPEDFQPQILVPYGDYHVSVVLDAQIKADPMIARIQAQFALAEQRGFRPDQNSILLVNVCKTTEADYAGSFGNYNRYFAYCGIDCATQFNCLEINLEHINDSFDNAQTIEHELWHLIDYLGNHSGIRSDHPKDIPHDHVDRVQTSVIKSQKKKEGTSHGAIERFIVAKLDGFREYANHGSEWFVHQQMCHTRGLTPGTIEGYMVSHSLLDTVLDEFKRLMNGGVARSQARNVWQKLVWNQMVEYRPYWRERLDAKGWKWLLHK
jgi:hypothetical protein